MTELAAALRSLATAPSLLVALDFDGVLSPIVPVPGDARPLPAAVSAVRGLATRAGTTVALLSGRSLADLAQVSGFAAPIRLVGSHGLEFAGQEPATGLDPAAADRLDRLHAALRELVAGVPGARLDAKPTGFAVHVRNAAPADAQRVLSGIHAGPARWGGIHLTPGKQVLDLAVVEVDKGRALDRLRAETGADAVLFAGDDVTDESALARIGPGDVGVKVGAGDTVARFRVPDPPALAEVLHTLLTARS